VHLTCAEILSLRCTLSWLWIVCSGLYLVSKFLLCEEFITNLDSGLFYSPMIYGEFRSVLLL